MFVLWEGHREGEAGLRWQLAQISWEVETASGSGGSPPLQEQASHFVKISSSSHFVKSIFLFAMLLILSQRSLLDGRFAYMLGLSQQNMGIHWSYCWLKRFFFGQKGGQLDFFDVFVPPIVHRWGSSHVLKVSQNIFQFKCLSLCDRIKW